MIEDQGEEIDPSIESIVQKAVYKEDGLSKIKIGDKAVEYNPEFRLFMTSKLANPHFLPDVSIKVTVVNFTVTFDGLDEQLLADAVMNLDKQVEKQRDQLVIDIANIKNEQFEMQSSILISLSESNESTILDNVQLIETLQTSK